MVFKAVYKSGSVIPSNALSVVVVVFVVVVTAFLPVPVVLVVVTVDEEYPVTSIFPTAASSTLSTVILIILSA